ncbi:MAG TPA: hypothetical protein VF177_16925 [Anaerolineae bacterium]
MHVNFFDESPKPREDVRIKNLGLYVYPDRRRLAVGFDITPFLERPSIEVKITNARGEPAGSLNVIETLDANFSLTMHLRDKEPTDLYEITATLYYATPETERVDVHTKTATFDVTEPGEK